MIDRSRVLSQTQKMQKRMEDDTFHPTKRNTRDQFTSCCVSCQFHLQQIRTKKIRLPVKFQYHWRWKGVMWGPIENELLDFCLGFFFLISAYLCALFAIYIDFILYILIFICIGTLWDFFDGRSLYFLALKVMSRQVFYIVKSFPTTVCLA